ncbi:MAG: PAS domain-containing protein [Burkholderiaceae bacterium]
MGQDSCESSGSSLIARPAAGFPDATGGRARRTGAGGGARVFLLCAAGRITAANPAAEQLLGLSRAQLLGVTSADPRWHAIREDGTPFPGDEHPSMTTLRTGVAQRDVVMGVFNPRLDAYLWISVTSQPVVPGADTCCAATSQPPSTPTSSPRSRAPPITCSP